MKKLSLLLATLLVCGAICVGCAPEDPYASLGGSSNSSSVQQTTTVTFDTIYGAVSMPNTVITTGETYTLPTPIEPAGPKLYKFEGWAYNGTILPQTGTWDIQASSILLTAVWKVNFTMVTFNTKGWGTVDPITVRLVRGEAYQLPTELILSEAEKQWDEYSFDGWKYNGTKIANSGTWTLEEDAIELVASLNRNYTNAH